jgi:transposase
VRGGSLWRAVLGVDKTVIEDVEFDEDAMVVVVSVRAVARERGRCGRCRRRCQGYDRGRAGRRRWRGLDSGTVRVFVEADSVRVECPVHGVVVAHVPWARHDAGHTHAFDAQVAWLATQASKSAITQLMRITWRTVGSIIARVWADTDQSVDRFEGLARIGIDEVSYRKHHRYLTVVVDHDTGRLLWAKAGRSKDTMRAFFDVLGPDRSRQLTHVSCDGATWITTVVAERAPQAVLCADPFHVVAWATDALDTVRREVWNIARRAPGGSRREDKGRSRPVNIAQGDARALKRARYTLWKNPENLTSHQRTKLAWIAKTHPYLHRAYLLKEGLRTVFKLPAPDAKHALQRWLQWAARSRIPEYIQLARRIRDHQPAIHASLDHGLSNALIESTNTKIRLITRIAYGFANPTNLIALALLTLGGHRPPLPGRP